MKIVVDAMGGDFAPKVNVDGAIDALREYPDMEIILVGPETLIEETISAYSNAEAMAKVRNRLTVVDAPEGHTTEEHPVWRCAARKIRPLSSAWISFAARKRRRLFPPVRRAR